MPNIKSVIAKHNKKILNSHVAPANNETCNYPNKNNCPLDGRCLSEAIVYKADVTAGANRKQYTGITQPVSNRDLQLTSTLS